MENKERKRRTNELSSDTKKSMLSRIITSIIIALLSIPAFVIGDWPFVIFTIVVLIIATREAMMAAKNSKSYFILHGLAYAAVAALSFWIFIKNNVIDLQAADISIWKFSEWSFSRNFKTLDVSTILVVFILIVLFVIIIFDRKLHFELATFLFLMVILLGLGFQSFTFLRFSPIQKGGRGIQTSFLLIYVILGAIFNDIGAYFIGVLFGKHKMAPILSPKKTWEGFVGGYVISFIISFGFALIVSYNGNPMLSFLSHNEWYWLLLLSLLMPLLANVGDLFFSALKRNFEIKDYGKLLKGHGGILDRIDSILVVCLGISTIIIMISNGWNILA